MPFTEFEKSASDGCLVCSQLLNRFASEYHERLREVGKEQEKKGEGWSVQFKFNYWPSPTVEVRAKFNFWNADDSISRNHDLYLVPADGMLCAISAIFVSGGL
jgi:hypothetical protein